EVEQYYNSIIDENDTTPDSYGLNSKVNKLNGQVVEIPWKVNGMYSEAIKKIVFWLNKAKMVAENPQQAVVIENLAKYYESGDLEDFNQYNIEWVKDINSHIDFINGFIEVYGDPLGMKGSWEAFVNFKDIEATKRAEILSKNALWFENNSPVDSRFKKEKVKGITAKVITAAILAGDMYPSTPIGINLPNPNWIRSRYGSKSVTLENITYAYDQVALGSGFLEEFAYTPEEIELSKKYGNLASNLHTDLHECLGHGSGKLLPGVSAEDLKNYHSPLEEARADLFALYYLMDEKLIELNLIPNLDLAKTEYNSYFRNGLITQLTRIEPGKNIEQAHMRCRQLISKWCYEKGQVQNVIEKIVKEGKTYFTIHDHLKLRELVKELLIEVQRINSEGDYKAAKAMVENYGVEVNKDLHQEVLERYKKLNLAPYGGFINPRYVPVFEGEKIVDVKIEYQTDYIEQMLYYSKNYSFLPNVN
ncbi:dihydrofolate reductase, partial [Bacteroidota bacterium]